MKSFKGVCLWDSLFVSGLNQCRTWNCFACYGIFSEVGTAILAGSVLQNLYYLSPSGAITGLSLNMKVGGELWEVGGEHWMRLRIHRRAPKARSLKGGLCDLPQENFEKWSVIWCYLVHSEVIFRLLLRFRFHDEILSVESEWTLEVHKNSTQNILEEVYIIQGKMLTDFNEYL